MAKIDELLRKMTETGASDLHMSSCMPPLIRQHGDMKPLIEGAPANSPEQVMAMLDEIMPERNKKEFAETNDTDLAHEIPDLARFRVNVFRDRMGPGTVIRVIPSKILTTEQLGVPEAVKKLCYLSKGLVVVTGPTGSGKSTTLCAMVDLINRTRKDHIITIEDPIEFVHPNKSCLLNQREVNVHTKSFSRALRAALREDPNIVLVGEMRDLETVAIAIETAETGHLVFGTLHTNTAVSTVDRIIDQFPADRQMQIRVMLASSLKGVIAQTLCKKADGKGRVAALEVLIVNSAVSSLIRDMKTIQINNMMQVGKKHGMVLMNDSLEEFAKNKVITPDEAFIKSVEKDDMINRLNRLNLKITVLPDKPEGGAAPPSPTAAAVSAEKLTSIRKKV